MSGVGIGIVIIAFIIASVGEIKNGSLWKALFYILSAAINYCTIKM